MRTHPRYLTAQVKRDLKRKMVFVAGPRQVGKTTLARALPGAREGRLNRDVAEHRERILRRELPAAPLWIFDEIHKYRPADGRVSIARGLSGRTSPASSGFRIWGRSSA